MELSAAKSWMICGALAFASICLFPRDFALEDTRGVRTEPLRISSKKNSPAYTAFVMSDWKFSSNSQTQVSNQNAISLKTGQSFTWNEVVPSDMQKAEVSLAQNERAEPKPQLRGMVISTRLVTNPEQEVATRSRDWVTELKATLPTNQAQRLAQVEDWVKEQDWAAPAPAEQWQKKVTTPAPTDQKERTLVAQGGGQIYVGRPDVSNLQASAPSPPPESSPVQPVDWRHSQNEADKNNRPLTLAGHLEMKSGLAFLGSQTSLVVTRNLAGRDVESGTVWVSEGRFEIYVKEPKGYLVAELKDAQGAVLGRGVYDLYKLPQAADHQVRVEGIALDINPVISGSQVATLSGHSFGGYEIPVDEAHVKSPAHDLEFKSADHLHGTEDFQDGSTALLEAQSEKSLTSIELSQLSNEEEVFLFEPKYIQAMVQLVSPEEASLIQEKGFIIGRVADQGRAVNGAVVEIAGDFSAEPIYFNEAFLPDRNIKSTSSNGLFAVVLAEPALYSIRAQVQGVYLPAKVLPVEAGKITQSLIERRDIKSLALNLFNYPEDHAVFNRARVSLLGSADEHEFGLGSQVLQYHEGRGVFILETDLGDFEPLIRMELPHGTTSAQLPLVSGTWLNALATKKRINLDPQSGRAFGFGGSEAFEVIVDQGQGKESIVYLDASGQPSYKPTGEPGGSFVIYNLTPGMHTVSVYSKNGSKIFSQVIVAEYQVINLIKTH